MYNILWKIFMFLFLVFSLLLLCLFFRLKELFQVKNGVTTFFFFFENAKNLGRSDDGKRRKKRGWPIRKNLFSTAEHPRATRSLVWLLLDVSDWPQARHTSKLFHGKPYTAVKTLSDSDQTPPAAAFRTEFFVDHRGVLLFLNSRARTICKKQQQQQQREA